MAYDLVIRNGTVIDGTGAPRRQASVAVVGSRIAAVGKIDESGREEIDAEGCVVSPGFVDGHTHMDAQVFWDELGTSSCWHGVTTVVMGNCGFTLAPARPDGRALVVRNLERAEDISADAMAEGIVWTWATFGEYLDAVDATAKGINYACCIGHSALRTWAMGERAFSDPASSDDLAVMERELIDGLHAGAVGFSTSRSPSHATPDGRPVASRLASWEEVEALVDVVRRTSSAGFQLAAEFLTPESLGPRDPAEREHYKRRLQRLALSSGVPTIFGLSAAPTNMNMLEVIEETVAGGGQMYGLINCRGASSIFSFQTRLPFDALAEWGRLRGEPLDHQRRLLQDPALRAKLVREAHRGDARSAMGPLHPDFDAIEIMISPYKPNPTVGQMARERRVDPVDLMIDLALEHDFDLFFVQRFAEFDEPDERKFVAMLRNENTAMTFSDAGAHVGQIVDASIQTHLLAYWVREREALSLEEAIQMITRRPADIWRLHDRGLLRQGFAADITIFDPETVAPDLPRVVRDLPGGARRLIQTAKGYKATIVNGHVFLRDGQPTEARRGQLLRAGHGALTQGYG